MQAVTTDKRREHPATSDERDEQPVVTDEDGNHPVITDERGGVPPVDEHSESAVTTNERCEHPATSDERGVADEDGNHLVETDKRGELTVTADELWQNAVSTDESDRHTFPSAGERFNGQRTNLRFRKPPPSSYFDEKRCLSRHGEQCDEDNTNADPDYVNSSSDESSDESDSESDVLNDSVSKVNKVSARDAVPSAVPNSKNAARKVHPSSHLIDAPGNEEKQKEFGVYAQGPKKSNCKKVYDKRNFCTFCQKGLNGKMSNHLLTVHMSEERVRKVAKLVKRSKERSVQLQLMTNEGNFKHNIEVLKAEEGFLVVARRNAYDANSNYNVPVPTDYLPCEFCFKFFLHSSLWHHTPQCNVRKMFNLSVDGEDEEDEDESKSKIGMSSKQRSKRLVSSSVLADSNQDTSALENLLSRMNDGEEKRLVIRDQVIRQYALVDAEALGAPELQKLKDVHKVSCGARTLAKLVLAARENEPGCSLNDLLKPQKFDFVITLTKSMCDDSNLTMGSRLGHFLAHAISTKAAIALRTNDKERLDDAKNFKVLFETEWNKRINKVLLKRKQFIENSKRTDIPHTDDLVKLRSYLVLRMETLTERMTSGNVSALDWKELCRATLCRLILFNKRRVSEVTNLHMEQYINRPKWSENNEEFNLSLSTVERDLARR